MSDCLICVAVRPEPDRVTPAPGYRACQAHVFAVADLLVTISRRMSFLSDSETLVRTIDRDTERWVGSRAPLDTNAVAALDRRTIATHRGDPLSGERVLRAWLYATLDLTGPDFWTASEPMPRFPVGFICTLLITHLPAIAATNAFPRFARHVAAVHDHLYRLTPNY